MEIINLRNPRGIAKVLGTLISLAGVTTMTLYKGPIVKNILQPLIRIQGNSAPHEDWIKGSLLTVSSCITWSIWYIMQVLIKLLLENPYKSKRNSIIKTLQSLSNHPGFSLL